MQWPCPHGRLTRPTYLSHAFRPLPATLGISTPVTASLESFTVSKHERGWRRPPRRCLSRSFKRFSTSLLASPAGCDPRNTNLKMAWCQHKSAMAFPTNCTTPVAAGFLCCRPCKPSWLAKSLADHLCACRDPNKEVDEASGSTSRSSSGWDAVPERLRRHPRSMLGRLRKLSEKATSVKPVAYSSKTNAASRSSNDESSSDDMPGLEPIPAPSARAPDAGGTPRPEPSGVLRSKRAKSTRRLHPSHAGYICIAAQVAGNGFPEPETAEHLCVVQVADKRLPAPEGPDIFV